MGYVRAVLCLVVKGRGSKRVIPCEILDHERIHWIDTVQGRRLVSAAFFFSLRIREVAALDGGYVNGCRLLEIVVSKFERDFPCPE